MKKKFEHKQLQLNTNKKPQLSAIIPEIQRHKIEVRY